MSLLSSKKFFRPNNLSKLGFSFCFQQGATLERWSWPEQELPLSFVSRTSWIDIQQALRALGTCGHPTPPEDICFASSGWGGWFPFAPHLFPIKSYKTPIKMVTKQKLSQVQLDWNFLYQFCHFQRLPHNTEEKKCGLIHSGGPGNAFPSCSYEMSCCHSRFLCPEMTQPVGREGKFHVLCSWFHAHLWSSTGNGNLRMLGKNLGEKKNLHFHIIRLILTSQSNLWKSKKESWRYKYH